MKPTNFLVILAVTAFLSAYAAWLRAERGHEPAAAGPDSVAGITLIRRAEAEKLAKDPAVIFLDVRSESDYEFGHLPGALHLPEEAFEDRFPALQPRLEHARTIVVYCKSRDCGQSLWSAIRLRNAGLTQTVIYPDGWNDWYLAELPIERGSR